MALLYPWATKEYLLWEMSLAQIVLYHNMGYEIKYPTQSSKPKRAAEMSHEELKAVRDECRAKYGAAAIDIGGDNG